MWQRVDLDILQNSTWYNYKTWIHTIIKQTLTDLYNYMSNYTWLYVQLNEWIY